MATNAAESGYQGWRNYETWCVNLWLNNDQGIYETCRDTADECRARAKGDRAVQSGSWTREEAARYLTADAIKEMVNEMMPDLGASMASDLLSASLQEVDWTAIADGFLES